MHHALHHVIRNPLKSLSCESHTEPGTSNEIHLNCTMIWKSSGDKPSVFGYSEQPPLLNAYCTHDAARFKNIQNYCIQRYNLSFPINLFDVFSMFNPIFDNKTHH